MAINLRRRRRLPICRRRWFAGVFVLVQHRFAIRRQQRCVIWICRLGIKRCGRRCWWFHGGIVRTWTSIRIVWWKVGRRRWWLDWRWVVKWLAFALYDFDVDVDAMQLKCNNLWCENKIELFLFCSWHNKIHAKSMSCQSDGWSSYLFKLKPIRLPSTIGIFILTTNTGKLL